MNASRRQPARVALVHDWLNQLGGAENVLEELVALFPGAPVYTSIYAPNQMPPSYRTWDIRTSFMQHLPMVTTHHQRYLALYPAAFANFRVTDVDLVLSNKSGFCHGIGLGEPRPLHVCYCLTPTRYLWLYDQYRKRENIGGALNVALQPLLAMMRRWDYAAAQQVDHFIAISRTVQERIRQIYGRESVVIHPPVDTDYFAPDPWATQEDYYLIVSRLIPYKRIDLAVEAMRNLPQEKLLVVGDGRDLAALRAGAGPNVHFLGRQSRGRIRELLRGCKAFLFPGLEDFGIAPVEAMSVGRPVVAFGGGGALDTVVPGVTGELFDQQCAESLTTALAEFNPRRYDPAACQTQAARFSIASFRRNLTTYLGELLAAPVTTTALPQAQETKIAITRVERGEGEQMPGESQPRSVGV
jgi:glycosyltransferase involved in cell wall biosynthesis